MAHQQSEETYIARSDKKKASVSSAYNNDNNNVRSTHSKYVQWDHTLFAYLEYVSGLRDCLCIYIKVMYND